MVLLLKFDDARVLTSTKNRATSTTSCKAGEEQTNIPAFLAGFLTTRVKGLRLMRIALHKLDASHQTANDKALSLCEIASALRDRGDYEGAGKALSPLWTRIGERPQLEGLHNSVIAEVLLCVGILTGWLGGKHDVTDAQELAKNLITEGTTFYESIGDVMRVAAAHVELARCYWRQGELNEARTMLNEALQKLTAVGNTRARALVMLATVEWTASRYELALSILTQNASLFTRITNQNTKGNYHNELAIVLRHLASSGNRDYLRRAIIEFEKADHHFKLAKNSTFRASVKNNVGLILFNLSRHKEAHEYLEQARSLTLRLRAKLTTAQIDDTRAQVFIAQKKFKQAEAVARLAVRALERSGHQCLLTDALITHGIALARLKRADPAQFTFQRAIEFASQVGVPNKAGIAALTLIEELDELSPETLFAAYTQANEWLVKSQNQGLLLRLNAAARKVCSALYGTAKDETAGADEDAIETLLNKPCVLQTEVLKFEGQVIQQALSKANGSLTRAAAMLSMSYQALGYILESRHRELLKERSPIRRRSRKEATP
jgi:tetratricopeptide (TPR) repeat protein